MKVIDSKELLKTKIFTVTEDHAKDPDGFEIRRAIVRHPGSAVMMAVDDRDGVLLVRQYRLPAQDFLWELPAGRLDSGEQARDAAIRELKEETGYEASEWTELASFFPSPGFLQEKMTIFLARHLTKGEQKPMDDERIETRWFSREELDRMIRDREIQDGKTICGFLVWQRYHAETSAG
jgi:ADP-ribose pyrophosphatase